MEVYEKLHSGELHQFIGKWITDGEFYNLLPRNVFFRQLERPVLDCREHRNRHILFRKKFELSEPVSAAKIYISADDYYKLYINGHFVAQGPTASYSFQYNYNELDVTAYLVPGENTIAVHTLYQGLINRVWQSGDNRHGLLLDLVVDGKNIVSSDESFLTHPHTGFREVGTVGYDTQFLEEYDSNAPEVGFQNPDFDDSAWEQAKISAVADYKMTAQSSKMLVYEEIQPKVLEIEQNRVFADFGSNYVGCLCAKVVGKQGETVLVRCGQELREDGTVRWEMRANCKYEEPWILGQGESELDQFDYKAFRYAELLLPQGSELKELYFHIRHYPFALKAEMKKEYRKSENLRRIWDLCVHSQKYGVQEVIQDCMEREKGFYMGDGCYTALTNMVLTGDDSMVRKLIDDGFATSFITGGLMTCMDCSFMQEVAEYPMMMLFLVLWHYRLTGDKAYLAENYQKSVRVLESYRRDYEKDGLLRDLDKWCVVEWPKNFRDGYDVEIKEGKVCHQPHVSINAYYLSAVKTVNQMAEVLKLEPYRDETELYDAFIGAFYNKETHLFRDGTETEHVSLVGNVMPFAFALCPDEVCKEKIANMVLERKISALSMFCAFPTLMGFIRSGKQSEIPALMQDEGAWLRMLREDATTTFEGWGKDTKKNASLFHLTLSYGALFLTDIDLESLLSQKTGEDCPN